MRLFLVLCLILFPQTVFGQIYKCKTPQGKIIYGQTPCEGATAQQLKLTVTPSSSPREISEAKTSVVVKTVREDAITEPEAAPNPYAMLEDSKQKRIQENLEISESRHSSHEKREDALEENKMLGKDLVNDLNHMDEVKRRELKFDLDSIDKVKRFRAASQLRAIYNKYNQP